MAEIGYGIAVKVLELLGLVTFQEISSAWGVKSDLTKLERTVKAVKAVLLDAEEKQASDHRLSIWLGELKDVLKDAENVLDKFQYIVLQKEVMKRNGSTSKKVSNFFSSSNPLAVRFVMAHKIKGIRKRVDEIAAEKDKFNLAQGLVDRKLNIQERRDMTHSFVPSQNVIGRNDDKIQIIDLLMQQDAGRNVSVIPIVGIGGLGKTTLAKLVYNNELVERHFQLTMWVCVSEDFNVTRLIKEILKSELVTIDENLSLDQLQIQLRGLLKDKKFLLVLDDVWNEDRRKWIELENLLLGGCKGSKILVTTRNSFVATVMGTATTYILKGLPEEDCMSLFVKLAFKVGQENQYPNLLNIGREIVKKCEGVPLAVSTLAGLLYSKVDEREWEFVRDNEIWRLKQNAGDILSTLKLSYNQLPFHLKQCFAYCSVFPKDFQFDNNLLIQFWMAHGILQSPVHENQELEDVGELYIKDLLLRSFFQDVNQEDICRYTFKMHDLVHDLALSIAKCECSVVTKKSTLAAGVCHLSFLENGQEATTQLEKLSKVQTIIFKTEQPASLLEACIVRFKYLRMLDLNNSSFKVLPSSIGSLKHLRYLDLSNNCRIKQLPDSICKLHSFQTLLLKCCSNLERLPKGIRDIISLRFLIVTTKHTCLSEKAVGCLDSLRHLEIYGCENLKCVFEGMEDGRLTNLRTLMVGECPSLTSLSLNTKHLTALENLIIWDCEELSLTDKEENQDLKLSLRLLTIVYLPKLEVLPQWLQASANTLQHLKIEDCCNFTALPEWLPHLKSLQTLKIKDCPVSSSSLPEGMQDLTALREIHIQNCEELSLSDKEENQAIKLSLRLLMIENLLKLEVLPQWLQASTNTLQHLEIAYCCNFTALPEWLPHLKSLQTLRIKFCLVFSSLPKGMQDLIALREFQILGCPKLSRKCREEVRHKIAHVPNIDFDDYFDEETGSSSERDDNIRVYIN
ncbi:disease resistance protein RGA2 [Quercus suber]|uniref:disease resistance protein RGA2 n=1 Tax=Quercus suber TaxID=58331 RepID=UPI000CE17817|nr:disease resistance protein RGA2-like [Quercus suber]